jgi:hypothetical protein
VASSKGNGGKPNDKKTPPHDGYRLGGATRGGKHADRGGKAGTSRTADPKTSKRIGRPPGSHRKGS